MRHILRQRELVPDDVALPRRGRCAAGDGADRAVRRTAQRPRALVRLERPARRAPARRSIAWRSSRTQLPRLDLVAVEFPEPRAKAAAITQGRLLRERFDFHGELRASALA